MGSGYPGVIHFVNVKGGTLLGKPVYRSILEVPNPVELAAMLIPADQVAPTLKACGQRGVRAVIVGAGGFRETGPEGAALEEEIIKIAKSYNIRLLGPNCIGLLDTHLPMDATFLPPPGPTIGDVAFVSHSGAICAAVIDWARGQGFGLSRLVSLGNQADVNETDMLVPVASDPHTNVVTLYLESISDGRRFVEQARQVTMEKPLIALKVGRFESGQRAAASHTGALAGEEHAFDAAFTRAGVLRAETSEEMFDWARALAWCPPAKGKNVAVITNAGGPGVTAADTLEAEGLRLAEFNEETRNALKEVLPPAASIGNPVDLLASATPTQFSESLKITLEDPGVDSAMVIFPPPPMFTAGAVAKAIIPIIHSSEKPVVVAVMGERLIQEAVEHLRAVHIPEYRFPERAAAALAVLSRRGDLMQSSQETPRIFTDVQPEVVQRVIEDSKNGEFMPTDKAHDVLEAYGIPVIRMHLAENPKQAAELAEKIGFPVALKVASADISHKSDIGGVMLNLSDADTVQQGCQMILEQARKAQPEARIDGVHVQRMVHSGQEVIAGAIQDPQFGGLVMFGSGGVEVEGLKDVAFSLAPLTPTEAGQMLASTWAGRKLAGFRNHPPADKDSVLEILFRLAQLVADHPRLAEVEINPLRVLEEDEGVMAIDVRVRVE